MNASSNTARNGDEPEVNFFAVLGPFRATVSGRRVGVDSAKLRILLASLLLHANTTVTSDQLIEYLWQEESLAHPRATLHTYVRRLRQLLGDPGLLTTTSTGYSIDLTDDEFDLFRFRALVRASSQQHDPAERAAKLRSALDLWRGQALVDVPSEALARDAAAHLEEERVAALEAWFETELLLGRHTQMIAGLRVATTDHPFRERFWGLLMLALYRADRQAEALDTYRRARTELVDQLGIEPGERLTAIHRGILDSDPGLALSRPTSPPVPVTPAQLPPETIGFVGRRELGDQVEAMLTPVPGRTGVPVVVLTGPPGVGKTALAVSLGRRVRQAFPDGQLYVDLRGDERREVGPPRPPESVLAQFLRGLGVPAADIPVQLVEQVNLYRSVLDGKNVLVVLDNAAGIDQIEPLIPGEAGCSVLITSRHRLHALVARQGARVVQVDALRESESRELIATMLRHTGLEAGPDLVADVAGLCAHLPLALRIAAANLVNAPGGRIETYLESLRAGNRLRVLSLDGDPAATVSAAIGSSYDLLAPRDRRIFCLAGLFPGADFPLEALAALTRSPPHELAACLERLCAANLLQQPAPGRYQFHDLLREYAQDRMAAEHAAGRAGALARLGQWYLAATRNAAAVVHSEFVRLAERSDEPVVTDVPRFADESHATAWLHAQWRNVVDLIRFFGGARPEPVCWYLADAMRGFFWTGRYRTEWQDSALIGLDAAQRLGDRSGVAAMHRSLANLNNTLGEYPRAMEHHQASLAVHEDLGMAEETAAVLNNLGLAHLSLGHLDKAETVARRALGIATDIASPRTAATSRGLLGSIQWARGDMEAATTSISVSLLTARAEHLHHISGHGLRILGLIRQELGDLGPARAYFAEALAISATIASLYDRSIALYGLALVHHDHGQDEAAFEYAGQALTAFQECGDRTYEVQARCLMSAITAARGDWSGAGGYALAAYEDATRIEYVDGQAHALARLAAVDARLGQMDQAAANAAAARARMRDGSNQITWRRVLSEIGPVHLDLGEPEQARADGHQLVDLCRATGQRLGVAQGLALLSRCARTAGQDDLADHRWKEALEVLTQIGVPPSVVLGAPDEPAPPDRSTPPEPPTASRPPTPSPRSAASGPPTPSPPSATSGPRAASGPPVAPSRPTGATR